MQNGIFNVLMFKAYANLRTEVSRYYLNYLWWAIEPIMTMGVFYVVFGIFMNRGTPNFVAFLLIGLTVWNWFARSVQHSCMSIVGGKGLMVQVNICKLFFPLEVFLRDSFKHLFVVVLLLIFLAFYTAPVEITWLAFPVIMLVQAVLVLAVSIFFAALIPFVPDLSFVITTGIQLLFFGSGVFYRIEDVVLPKHRFIMYLNPMAGIIKESRDVLIYAKWPDWNYLGLVFGCSCVFLLLSILLVKKLDHIYPRVCLQ